MKKPCSRWSPFVIAFLSLALVVGLGIFAYRQLVPYNCVATALYAGYDTAEGLEMASEVVLIAIVSGKGKSIVDEDGRHYTFTPLKIGEVFKGSLQTGGEIKFVEPVGYQRRLTGLYFYGRRDYVPLKLGTSYLLFLKESEPGSGIYIPIGGMQGKFVWPPPQERTEEALEISGPVGDYWHLFDSVVEKYGTKD